MQKRSGFDVHTTTEAIDVRVAKLAARQHGVFARYQVDDLTRGVIQRRIASGRWEPLGPRVFRLPGTPATWRQSLMGACLIWGPDAAASHRSAGALVSLAGFDPGPIELTVPLNRRRSGDAVVHHNPLAPMDVIVVQGIPVTETSRTLIDLAAVVPPEALAEALDDALRRGLVSLARIRWRLTQLPTRRHGVAAMRSLLEQRSPGSIPQSRFETRLLRLLRSAGLPLPTLQHPVRDRGRVVAVVDFAYVAHRLAIEADGYRWHSM